MTESYIRALHEDGQPSGPDDDVESSVLARKERQTVFTKDDPPERSFILSESCLRRLVGDHAVMREHLQYLTEVACLHNVQIQVLPFDAKTYAGRNAYRFTLVNIPSPGLASPLEFAYVEAHDDARYLDDKDAVAAYSTLWGRLQAAALGPVESRNFIAEVAAQLG